MFMNCLAVGIGGFVGSVLRYLAGFAIPSNGFPLGTLTINIVGSFVLALIAGYVTGGVITDERLSLLLRVGLCGGFTTFSTYSLETMNLLRDGRTGAAVAYIALTVCLCLGASFAGSAIANMGRAA